MKLNGLDFRMRFISIQLSIQTLLLGDSSYAKTITQDQNISHFQLESRFYIHYLIPKQNWHKQYNVVEMLIQPRVYLVILEMLIYSVISFIISTRGFLSSKSCSTICHITQAKDMSTYIEPILVSFKSFRIWLSFYFYPHI